MEELSLSLPEDVELQPVGTVSSIIQQLGKHGHVQEVNCSKAPVETCRVWSNPCPLSVVIQSLKDAPPLTDDSILFRSDRTALAKVGQPPLNTPLRWYVPGLSNVILSPFRCLRCSVQCRVHYISYASTLQTRSPARA